MEIVYFAHRQSKLRQYKAMHHVAHAKYEQIRISQFLLS